MARDLIPPPSPAGRPEPEGGRPSASLREDLRGAPGEDRLLQVRPDDAESDRSAPRSRAASPYRARFGFITGALIGVAMAAVAAVVLLSSGGDKNASAQWSGWQPTATDDITRLRQIAIHVGTEYRQDDGTQLVDVDAGPLAINGIPLQLIVQTSQIGGDLLPIGGTGAFFVLTGFGANGSIEGGTVSTQRAALLRREALELTLYTFHYLKDVDHVVLILPPAPPGTPAAVSPTATPTPTPKATATPTPTVGLGLEAAATASQKEPLRALLLRPGDVEAQLTVPVRYTLPPTPPRPSTITEKEADVMTAFTNNYLFEASIRQAQTGEDFLLLKRPANETLTHLLAPTIKKSGG